MNNDCLQRLIKAENGEGEIFTCIEVNPPKGADISRIVERFTPEVLNRLNFINITDNALAMMRMSALPFASILKNKLQIEPLVNFTCRDRNILAMQSDLLAAYANSLRSVIALTGDALSVGEYSNNQAKGVFEFSSIGLLELVNKLNSGQDALSNKLEGHTQIVSGCVVNPNAKNPSAELRKLEKKIAAGAKYALSQPVFDEDSSVSFFKEAKNLKLPILMGLMPISSVNGARNLAKIPGLRLSPTIEAMIEKNPEANLKEFSLDLCKKLSLLNREYVVGFHIISGVNPKLALQLLQIIKETKFEN